MHRLLSGQFLGRASQGRARERGRSSTPASHDTIRHASPTTRDLAFAPAQLGLVLAAAGDDGVVYVWEGSPVAAGEGGGEGEGGVLAWTLLSTIKVGGGCNWKLAAEHALSRVACGSINNQPADY